MPAIIHRTGGPSAEQQNTCGKCGRTIYNRSGVWAIDIDREQECLTRRCREERARLGEGFVLPVELDLDSALCLIGNLQLALRHPANRGISSKVARQTIDGIMVRMREAGYVAHAELAALGDDPDPKGRSERIQDRGRIGPGFDS